MTAQAPGEPAVVANVQISIKSETPLLRCLHSVPSPIEKLPPGQSASQEGVILFCEGGHEEARAHFERLTGPRWAEKNT